LAREFRRAGARDTGSDFCLEMMRAAKQPAAFVAGDALLLPFREGQFDVASIGFGIRNVDDPVRCLREMARVVRPRGRVVVLEFGQPRGPFGALFRVYSSQIMPRVGGLLTGNRAAYEYLPRTAAAFPAGERFLWLMDEAGPFVQRSAHPLLAGTAYVYVGTVA